ncbi:MAG: TIGR04211 family SH3 domain-containing protein [Methylococcaceae bacterium]|nr:TIGR04211 family SH3 domain-containing protein [Methylococcaceae bacterium]
MKKNLIPLITLLCFNITAHAKTVYVTDTTKYTLRTSENTRSKIIKMLRTGTELTVISENKESGYSKVRTKRGAEGYILTRYTKNKPINKWFLDKANKKLQTLRKENRLLKKQLTQAPPIPLATPVQSDQAFFLERNKLSKELSELKTTASNAVQIRKQRDKLQERFITVERQLEQLKRENQSLKDSANQDWFLYGGFLSLLGVLLGIILPKLSLGRKSRSSWDTF